MVTRQGQVNPSHQINENATNRKRGARVRRLFKIPVRLQLSANKQVMFTWDIPPEAELAHARHTCRPDVTLENIFRNRPESDPFFRLKWDWMLVVLPGFYPIGGHMAEHRAGEKLNVIQADHDLQAPLVKMRPQSAFKYDPYVFACEPCVWSEVTVSLFWINTRGLLEVIAERGCSYFQRLAEVLTDVPPDGTWVYLADAPDASLLQELERDNVSRYSKAAHREFGPRFKDIELDPVGRLEREAALAAQAEQGLFTIERYLLRHPDDVRARMLHAHYAYRANQEGIAEEQAKIVSEQSPDWVYPWRHLAWIAMKQGRPQDALAHNQRVLNLLPLDHEALRMQGYCLQALGRYEESLTPLALLDRIGMRSHEENHALGYAYSQLNRWKEAEIQFGQAAQQYKKNHLYLNNYAYALAMNGDLLRAEFFSQLACHRAGKPIPSYLDTLGLVRLKQGRKDEAIALFREVLDLDSSHKEARAHLGEATTNRDHNEVSHG